MTPTHGYSRLQLLTSHPHLCISFNGPAIKNTIKILVSIFSTHSIFASLKSIFVVVTYSLFQALSALLPTFQTHLSHLTNFTDQQEWCTYTYNIYIYIFPDQTLLNVVFKLGELFRFFIFHLLHLFSSLSPSISD